MYGALLHEHLHFVVFQHETEMDINVIIVMIPHKIGHNI